MHWRVFLSRLLLAMAGLLLLGVAGVIALGWFVREPFDRSVDVLGKERGVRLHGTYVRLLGALLPADHDGDGFPDSVEWYLNFDPRDPRKHPTATILDEVDQGFITSEMVPKSQERHWDFLVQPGERRRMRVRVGIGGFPAAFARGLHMFIGLERDLPGEPASMSGRLLCLPGGTAASEPIQVPVAADGWVEFDLVIPEDAVISDERHGAAIFADHYELPLMFKDGPAFGVGWRRPPIPCTVEEVPRVRPAGRWGAVHKGPMVRLAWQPAERSGPYLIEATRDEARAEWFPVTVCPASNHSALISYELTNSRPDQRGPLKFRVIPTQPVPPEK